MEHAGRGSQADVAGACAGLYGGSPATSPGGPGFERRDTLYFPLACSARRNPKNVWEGKGAPELESASRPVRSHVPCLHVDHASTRVRSGRTRRRGACRRHRDVGSRYEEVVTDLAGGAKASVITISEAWWCVSSRSALTIFMHGLCHRAAPPTEAPFLCDPCGPERTQRALLASPKGISPGIRSARSPNPACSS